MNRNHKYLLTIFSTFVLTSTLIFSCNKNDEITGLVALEEYVNATGHEMQIIRYMRGQSDKSFSIARNDTLRVESPLDAGSDSTGSIFRADSAKVIFDDGKSFFVNDTTVAIPNFLNSKRTISASGKIHYYRYTFTELDYESAE